jgi:GNAT superfamily N-acetyltransferase
MDYDLTASLSEDMRGAIGSVLRSYNYSHNSTFFTARDLAENSPKPLNVVASDKGIIIGGLVAETQFLWLKISLMAVAHDARHRGIGRRLLEIAEREALTRGCQFAFTDTMDYRAPDFYRKLGYQIAGKLENWDSHGHAKYFFTKRL